MCRPLINGYVIGVAIRAAVIGELHRRAIRRGLFGMRPATLHRGHCRVVAARERSHRGPLRIAPRPAIGQDRAAIACPRPASVPGPVGHHGGSHQATEHNARAHRPFP